jgi:hypothetical protein
MKFELNSYKLVLESVISQSYSCLSFEEAYISKHKKSILIRHDIDMSLDQALEIAKVENSIGISSCFFIRLHAKFYNALSVDSKRKMNLIEDMGHRIGLHFEEDFYDTYDIFDAMATEKSLLDSFLRYKIDTIAPHEPSRTGRMTFDKSKLLRAGIKYQAYDNILFEKFKYISDSSCRWRDGTFEEHVNDRKTPRIYLLTHPIWWYYKTPIEVY